MGSFASFIDLFFFFYYGNYSFQWWYSGVLPEDSVYVNTVHKYILLSSHVKLLSDELHNMYSDGSKLLYMHFEDMFLSSLNEKLMECGNN